MSDEAVFRYAVIASLIVIAVLHIASWNIYDIWIFEDWVRVYDEHGLLGIYTYAEKAAYPPIPIVLWIFTYKLGVYFSELLFGSIFIPVVRFTTKLPLILAVYATVYMLYRYHGIKPALYFLLYYGIYNIICGFQFDPLVALGLLGSYTFIVRDKPVPSGLFLLLAVLTKHVTAVVLPFLLLLVYRRSGLEKAFYFLLAVVAGGTAVLAPFLLTDFYGFYYKTILFHSSRFPQEFSLYAIPLYLARFNYTVIPRVVTWIWIVPYAIAYFLLLLLLYRIRCSRWCILYGLTMILIVTLMLNKVGNTPYQLWATPFLALIVTHWDKRLPKILYILLPVVTMGLYGLLTLYTAAVVHGYIFIPEDLRYYNAEELVLESFRQAPPYADINTFLTISRLYFYDLFQTLYQNIWLTYIILTIYYQTTHTYFLYKITKRMRQRCRLTTRFNIKKIIRFKH